MKNSNIPLPMEDVRDIFATLTGTKVADFEAADVAALLSQGQVTASFGISRSPGDVEFAVNSAWPYPAGAPHVDAVVVVRGNGMNVARYTEIQGELRRKMHGTSSLFISVSSSDALPPGAVSIILLAIAHDRT